MLEKAASQEHAKAAVELAICYDQGSGVERDFKRAAHWAQQAATLGDIRGMPVLARYYLNGQDVEQDEAKAHQLNRQANRLALKREARKAHSED